MVAAAELVGLVPELLMYREGHFTQLLLVLGVLLPLLRFLLKAQMAEIQVLAIFRSLTVEVAVAVALLVQPHPLFGGVWTEVLVGVVVVIPATQIQRGVWAHPDKAMMVEMVGVLVYKV
jgi:hypothetical protein